MLLQSILVDIERLGVMLMQSILVDFERLGFMLSQSILVAFERLGVLLTQSILTWGFTSIYLNITWWIYYLEQSKRRRASIKDQRVLSEGL